MGDSIAIPTFAADSGTSLKGHPVANKDIVLFPNEKVAKSQVFLVSHQKIILVVQSQKPSS